MARDIIRTTDAPAPPPTYSQAVRAGGLVFVGYLDATLEF